MDADSQEKIANLVVLGGGTAGFLAAIACKSKMRNLRVTLVRSKAIGVIGVGEGTTPVVPSMLHGYLNLNPARFYERAAPTWKLGVRFHWGPFDHYNYTFSFQFGSVVTGLRRRSGFYALNDPCYSDPASALMSEDRVFMQSEDGVPLIGKDLAYHLENATFVRYLEDVARELGVEILNDRVLDVHVTEQGVAALQLDQRSRLQGDFFVDASGFRSVLLGGALEERYLGYDRTLFCDRAVIGGWLRSDAEPIKPYTTSDTMDAGWCWQVELENRVNRGYVYSSGFISDAEAEAEFRRLNPKLSDTRIVKFTSGRRMRTWVKNVVAIGNASGFVEPLESTSLGVICADAQALAESLAECDCHPNKSIIWAYNDRSARIWESIRDFLAVHYRFNQRRLTPFWKECNEKVELNTAERIVEYYRENGPSTLFAGFSVDHGDQFKLEGYITHLIGLGVPCDWKGRVTQDEWSTWKAHRSRMKEKAQHGLTVEQALKIVRSADWRWTPGFYK